MEFRSVYGSSRALGARDIAAGRRESLALGGGIRTNPIICRGLGAFPRCLLAVWAGRLHLLEQDSIVEFLGRLNFPWRFETPGDIGRP